MRRLTVLALAAGLLFAGRATAAPGLVVAVDTSRSLRPEEVAAIAELTRSSLRAVPGAPPTALLSFDDLPRWVTTAGPPAATVAALGTLVPQGQSTQLHDALFVAARSLQEGGAVLLLTDGRDESSATTIEDVARLCELHGVRIVAVGIGRDVQERSLRRLTLLTGGEYLGDLATVQPETLAAAARAALAAAPAPGAPRPVAGAPAPSSAAEAVPGTSPAAPAPAAGGPGAAEDGVGVAPAAFRTAPGENAPAGEKTAAAAASPAGRRWWLLAVPFALVAVATPVAVWAVRRQRNRADWCRRCGAEIPPGGECGECGEQLLQQRLRERESVRLEDTAEFRIDPETLARAAAEKPFNPDAIERTRVLTDQNVLLVREPGEAQRSYLLRGDGAFAIGRDPKSNTLALRDLALSAHHFKIVPEEGAWYVVDLESTNGIYLNQKRVRAARLSSGDVVRAGQVDFEFRTYLSGFG
jgi:hypothetical protein